MNLISKNKNLKRTHHVLHALLTFAGIFFTLALTAQNGNLSGKISDFSSGEPLPGANIYIEEIGMGTVTDFEGEYRILNIPAGEHAITYRYVGYVEQTQNYTIKANENNVLGVILKYDATDLGEVVVKAQMLGQAKAVNQQLNSDALVNIVSSDKMKELPDVNAAEAIGRLPGISVQRVGGEAQKIVVRGLSPKLTSITVNGIRVPPTGGNDRSVNLSMISPELLSSIEVFKSPTADMDGDAVGGVVNLRTMKAPLKPVASFRVHGGYNSLVNELGNYKGMMDLSRRFMDDKLGVYLKANYERTDRSSQSIAVGYKSDTGDEAPWIMTSASVNRDGRIISRSGLTLGLDYEYKSGEISGQLFNSLRKNELNSITHDFQDGTQVRNSMDASESKMSVLQGMLTGEQKLGFIEMDWALATSRSNNETYKDVGTYFNQPGGIVDTVEIYNIDQKLSMRTHNYDVGFMSGWYDNTRFNTQETYTAKVNFKSDFNLGGKFSGFVKFGAQYRSENKERDVDPYRIWRHYLNDVLNDRAANNMPVDIIRGGNSGRRIAMENFSRDFPQAGFWGNTYNIGPVFDFDFLDLWVENNQDLKAENKDNTRGHEKYEISETVTAGYFMAKINYSRWFTFIPGVRYEYSDNSYLGYINSKAFDGTGNIKDTITYQQYGELLPSFHLKLKPLKWFDIRMSAVKTISRPDYNMLVPRIRLDLANARIQKGNPNLKHLEAWNYDVQLSFFDNKWGLLTIGGFYKHFDNYFTDTDRVMGVDESRALGLPVLVYDVTEDYVNFDNSEVYGFEIDLQSNLDYLAPPFNGIVFNANLSRLWSKTYQPLYFKAEVYDPVRRITVVDIENSYFEYKETALPDQTEWISNFGIGYDHKGFSARFSMIYQSAYLRGLSGNSEVEGSQFNERYSDDYLRFDASFSQKIGDHIKVMLNLANLTGESERSYQYIQRYWRNENRYGMTIDAAIQYKF